MPGFSVTPVGPFPPVNSEDFPDFLQWQWEGVDIGDTAVDTVNLTGSGIAGMSVGTGENANVLTIEVEGGAGTLSWRDVPGDTTLTADDAENGLSCSGTTGEQNITVPSDGDVDFPDGTAILVYQAGAADVSFVAPSGVALNVREALTTALAGQYATATLIKRSTDNWIVCGDLAAA